jgi:Malectin domain
MSCMTTLSRLFRGLLLPAIAVGVSSVSLCTAQTDSKSTNDAGAASGSLPTIRMRAGSTTPFKDSNGNTWLPDAPTKDGGFEGGDTIDRPDDMAIQNTKDPGLFRSEHYGMDGFSYKLPNGKYVVKLYFAETYDGIGGPGDRVFSFKVQDKEFKDFDIWKKAGGPQKAYIETVPVDITDGKLKITFTTNVQNPAINGIEIIPADKAASADKNASK